MTDYPNWNKKDGGGVVIDEVEAPLQLVDNILSIDYATEADSGVVIINNTYPSIASNTDATTSNYVQTAITAALVNGKSFRGGYNASTNLFPSTGGSGTAGAIQGGDYWVITVDGTLGGTPVSENDTVLALINTPAQIAANWTINSANLVFDTNQFDVSGNDVSLKVGGITLDLLEPDGNDGKILTAAATTNPPKYRSLLPTAKRVSVTINSDDITLSTPQDTDVTATPEFISALLSGLTASKAVVTDGTKTLASSTATATEVGFLSGVTALIQSQLDSKQPAGSYISAITIAGTNGFAGSAIGGAITLSTSITGVIKGDGTALSAAASTDIAAIFPALTGDVTNTAGNVATTIANQAVTYAKIQNTSVGSVLIGRYAATSGTVQQITLGTGLALNSTTGVLSVSSFGGTTAQYIRGDGTAATFNTSVQTYLTSATQKVCNNIVIQGIQLTLLNSSDTSKSASIIVPSSQTTGTQLIHSLPDNTSQVLAGESNTLTFTNKTWQGAVIGPVYGGLGFSSYKIGQLFAASGNTTIAKVSPNITTTTMVLKQTGDGVDGTVPGWDVINSLDLPAGTILNCLSVTKLDTFSTSVVLSSGGAAVTGLSITITPKRSTSTFLLLATMITGGSTASSTSYSWFARSTTKIGAGTPVGVRLGVGARNWSSDNDGVNQCMVMSYVDSPATTSPVTYNVYLAATSASFAVNVNRSGGDLNNTTTGTRSSSTLTVFEISA